MKKIGTTILILWGIISLPLQILCRIVNILLHPLKMGIRDKSWEKENNERVKNGQDPIIYD